MGLLRIIRALEERLCEVMTGPVFYPRTPIPRFYQVHRGDRHYGSGKVTVLPFAEFCRELEMP